MLLAACAHRKEYTPLELLNGDNYTNREVRSDGTGYTADQNLYLGSLKEKTILISGRVMCGEPGVNQVPASRAVVSLIVNKKVVEEKSTGTAGEYGFKLNGEIPSDIALKAHHRCGHLQRPLKGLVRGENKISDIELK